MANNSKNLVPNEARTPEERRRNASKAGKASAAKRRKNKLLKDCMMQLLSAPITEYGKRKLDALGLDVENLDNRALLTAALFQRAVDLGDVAAFKEIRDLIGEGGQEQAETSREAGVLILPDLDR